MGRNAEAIKESFQSVTGPDKTKIFLAFRCQINNRCRTDGDRCKPFLQVSDSRYGCIRGDRAFKL